MQPPGTRYSLEVNPRIPKRLARLEELAGNLWYSWNRPTRSLFARMNPALWDAVGHCPKAMLKRIDEQRLIDAAADPAFLDSLTRVLAAFDAYHAEPPFKQREVLPVLTEQDRGVLVVVEVENDLGLRGVVGRGGRRNHGRCGAQAVQAPASAKTGARCGVASAPNKV